MSTVLDITFETYRPISQQLGMEFWSMGFHFGSIPGNATYRLQSRGEADTLSDAIEGLTAQIIVKVAEAYPDWPAARITRVLATEERQ